MQNKERWPDVTFTILENGCVDLQGGEKVRHLSASASGEYVAEHVAEAASELQAEVDSDRPRMIAAQTILATLGICEDDPIQPDPDLDSYENRGGI